MKTPREGEPLWEVISALYERYAGMPSVNPAWLATQGMVRIEFAAELHRLGYIGCHLQMRQIARQFCNRKFDPLQRIARAADDLFPDTLQVRYPVRPRQGEEPRYVLLDCLEPDDRAYNVERMRRAAGALLAHADALEADGLRKQAA
jgi:hypothetical protein